MPMVRCSYSDEGGSSAAVMIIEVSLKLKNYKVMTVIKFINKTLPSLDVPITQYFNLCSQ